MHGRPINLPGGDPHLFRDFAFSPDGKTIAAAGFQYEPARNLVVHYLTLTDAASGRPVRRGEWDERGDIRGIAYAPDGKTVALGGTEEAVRLWDPVTGQQALTLNGHTGSVMRVAFSPDSKRVASASEDQTVKLWDSVTGQETLTLKGHTGSVISVAFSPDGLCIASGSSDGTVKVWDARPLDAEPVLAGTDRVHP